MNKRYSYLFYLFIILLFVSCKQKITSNHKTKGNLYLNPDYSIENRVDDLISQMTLEEKVSQLMFFSDSIERLKIPQFNWMIERANNLSSKDFHKTFPMPLSLAASFDIELTYKIADIISTEIRAKYNKQNNSSNNSNNINLSFLGPSMNILIDPRWEKGEETFGEDPFLASKLMSAFLLGMQGDNPKYLKTITIPVYYSYFNANIYSTKLYTQELYNSYIPLYSLCIKNKVLNALMFSSYINTNNSLSNYNQIFYNILRDKLNYNACIMPDFSLNKNNEIMNIRTSSLSNIAAKSLQSGIDLEQKILYKYLIKAVKEGVVLEKEIDSALGRLLYIRFKLGQFDPPEMNDYSKIVFDSIYCSFKKNLSLEAAKKSIVLLKNHKNLLPLNPDKIKSIAVIGPYANIEDIYSKNNLSLYKSLKTFLSNKADLHYLPGCNYNQNTPVLDTIPRKMFFQDNKGKNQGLKLEYFNNKELTGKPIINKIDSNINNYWSNKMLDKNIDLKNYSISWTGYLKPDKTSRYAIGSLGTGKYKVFLQDTLFIDSDSAQQNSTPFHWTKLYAKKLYKIRVDFISESDNNVIKLLWFIDEPKEIKENAINLAKESDVVILSLGLTPSIKYYNTLNKDSKNDFNNSLELPNEQIELMKSIFEVNKKIVLVLTNGSALSINWADKNIPSIIESWNGEQEISAALTDVIFGEYNPSGRLPITFYKYVHELPPFNKPDIIGRTYRYCSKKPLYPFGYGLSYSSFSYNNIRLERANIFKGESTHLLCEITNSGKVQGVEVAQIYISKNLKENIFTPIKELKGFKNISLKPGETTTVSFEINPELLSNYNYEQTKYMEQSGLYNIMIGPNSMNLNTLDLKVQED